MATVQITLTVPKNDATVRGWLRLVPGFSPESLQRIGSYFMGIAGGPFNGRASVVFGTGTATATTTFTSTGPVAAETMSLLNQTITAVTTITDATNQFVRSDTPSVDATNLAALINSSALFNTRLSATAALGVVTISSLVSGIAGNGYQISEAMTNTAIAQFSGGTSSTPVVVYNGY